MSWNVDLKECLVLKWEATLSGAGGTSPQFRFRATDWYLAYGVSSYIRLWLHPVTGSKPSDATDKQPFGVSIRVDGGTGRVLYELDNRQEDWIPGRWIWCRLIEDVESALPNYRFDLRITFRVTIEEKVTRKGKYK